MWTRTDRQIGEFNKIIALIKSLREEALDKIECGFKDITKDILSWEKCTINDEGDYYEIKQTRYYIYKQLCDNYTIGSYGDISNIQTMLEEDIKEYLEEKGYITTDGINFFKNKQVYEFAKDLINSHKKGEQ